VLHSVTDGLGFEWIDLFECGLLRNKLNEYLETYVYGWLVLRPEGEAVVTESEDEEDDDLCIPTPR
jgi:hypothetical protein